MKRLLTLWTLAALISITARATIEGSLDPAACVAEWSDTSSYTKIIDINFGDADVWPDTWTGETGKDCPEYADGGYANAIIEVAANGDTLVTYPINFHNCIWATTESYMGYAGATAAFCRQYYLGENCNGNSASTYNNWTVSGHTKYLEDNITYDSSGTPNYGEAGFVQMCRDASADGETSLHGWVEIDHVPYIDVIQWSWSSTAWGRGIKCDIKIGDNDWEPLVWMGYGKHKQGYTVFSDQGYFMENEIHASDVSLRWRVWDGDTSVQTDTLGNVVFSVAIDSLAQQQAPRLHKLQIFGTDITEEDAEYARNNPVNSVGEITDLDSLTGGDSTTAPDDDAPVVLITVAQDGTGDYTSIQDAIDAVDDGYRGIIYIRPGEYDEHVLSGTKDDHDKYISLIGEDKATTILTSSVDRGENNSSNEYTDCAALLVYTPRFYAENLTIQNTSGNVGQAEALYTSGDAHIFRNCDITGYQDTYKANVSARGYFTGCTISGATDFIYDSGLEWFEDCDIVSVAGGYITAAGDASISMTQLLYPTLSTSPFYAGLFFRNCNITAEDGVSDSSVYLGRPWKEKCGTMFLQCTLGDHITAAGWASWDGNEESASYMEYENTDSDGNAVDTSSRASFSSQATAEEVEAYMNPEFMFAKLSDTPFDYETILGGAATPTITATDNGFVWTSDELAAGYLIYKDGEFVKFTDDGSYDVSSDDTSVYTIKVVSRHGVTSDEVVMEQTDELLAFPTAAGFGKYASGGRGGQVVYVTSLDDDADTEGTLRWAIEQYPDEPLTIEFAVSGTIALEEELKISRADWTMAGQTAPGDGIVITQNKVNVGGSENFIVRNMRFRVGQKDANGDVLPENALGAENCSNFIFDHCSFGWSVEENMNTADSHFLTVQYSIVHEGLYNAGHSKGARGYGTQWGGSPATYHHNLLAHNNSRSPRFNGARGEDYVVFLEYINNVNYNFGGTSGCYGGENTADITSYNGLNSAHDCNFMNNYYKPGAASSTSGWIFFTSSYARDGATSWAPAQWYVDGNIIEGYDDANSDNWSAIAVETYTLDDIKADERIVTETPYYKYSMVGNSGEYVPQRYMIYDYETAEEAYTTVINSAGTINRDKVETRVAEEAANGTYTYTGSVSGGKGIIDVETDAEGFYDYSTDYTVPTDTDGDGMPDDWETTYGLDPEVADQNTLNTDGYTALEVYLNSLMGETMDTDFTAISAVRTTAPQLGYDAQSGTLTVSDNAIGSTLRVYATNGVLLRQQTITSTTTRLNGLPGGLLLIQVTGNNLRPRTIKTMK